MYLDTLERRSTNYKIHVREDLQRKRQPSTCVRILLELG